MSAEGNSAGRAEQSLIDSDLDREAVDSEESGAESTEAPAQQDPAHPGSECSNAKSPEGATPVPFRPRGPPSKPASGRPAVKPKPKPKPK